MIYNFSVNLFLTEMIISMINFFFLQHLRSVWFQQNQIFIYQSSSAPVFQLFLYVFIIPFSHLFMVF
jgi:hypothetical protein